MTKEEADNGRDDMVIDGPEQANAVPDGFNANYLRIYYGQNSHFILKDFSSYCLNNRKFLLF